jgi:fibronectin-binding autotransporter adhesin
MCRSLVDYRSRFADCDTRLPQHAVAGNPENPRRFSALPTWASITRLRGRAREDFFHGQLVALACSIMAAIASPAGQAATVDWTYGAQSGGWNQTTNWSTGAIPVTTDDASINWFSVPEPAGGWPVGRSPAENNYAVTLNNNRTIRSLLVSGPLPLNLWGNGPTSSVTQARTLTLSDGIRVAADSGPVLIGGSTTMSYRNMLVTLGKSQSFVNASDEQLTFGYSSVITGGNTAATTGDTLTFSAGGEGDIVVYGIIRNGSTPGGVRVVVDSAGAGRLVLTGDNIYTGGTTLRRGTLVVDHPGAVPGSGGLVFEGGTLAYGFGQTVDVSNRFTAAPNQVYRIDTGVESIEFASEIDSPGGSLIKLGPGELLLSGTNTYTGGTTISEGMLSFAAGSLPAVGAVTIGTGGGLVATGPYAGPAAWLASGRIATGSSGSILFDGDSAANVSFVGYGSLSLGASEDAIFSGVVTPAGSEYRLGGGAGRLTVASTLTGAHGLTVAGDVALAAVNSFTGPITLVGGELTVSTAEALGSGGAIAFAGGTLRYSAANAIDYSNRFSSSAGQRIAIDTAGRDVTFASPVTSAGGGLAKFGEGRLNITAPGAWSDTVVAGGTLALSGGATVGTGSLSVSGGTLDLGGGTATVSDLLVLGGTITNGLVIPTSSPIQLIDGAVSARIGGATGLVKTGPGTVTLSGVNSYSGGTVIEDGILEFATAASLPAGAAGDIVLDGGSLVAAGPHASVTAWLTSGRIASESVGGLLMTPASSILDAVTGIDMSAYPDLALGAGGFVNYPGSVTPAVPTGDSVPAWWFAGGGGTLTLSSPLPAVTADLDVGPDLTLVLAANAAATGVTTVTSATLRVGNGGTAGGLPTGAVVVADGGRLEFDRSDAVSIANSLTLNGGILHAARGSVTIIGDVTQLEGDRNETLYDSSRPAPVSTVFSAAAGATLTVSADGLFSDARVNVGPGIEFSGAGTGVFARSITATTDRVATVFKRGTGTWTLSNPANNWSVGGLRIEEGTLKLGASEVIPHGSQRGLVLVEAGGRLDLAGFSEEVVGLNGTGTVDNSAAGPSTLTINGGSSNPSEFLGSIRSSSGPLSLVKRGAGQFTIAGDNTYGGSTQVEDGTLLVERAASLPGFGTPGRVNVSGGTLTLRLGPTAWTSPDLTALVSAAPFNGGVLGLNVPGGASFSHVGNLGAAQPFKNIVKLGSGTLSLDGVNTYTGTTTVTNGTLVAATPAALSGYDSLLAVTVNSGGVLGVRAGGTGGWRTLDIESVLTNAFFTGTGAFAVEVPDGQAFSLETDVGLGGTTKGFVKLGPGALTLSAANTYTGATTVAAGTLIVAGDQSAATGGLTVAAGGTLGGSGTVGGPVTVAANATLSPGASPGNLSFAKGVALSGAGAYNWQIRDAAGTAGSPTGWDLLSIGGALTINATSANPFNINLWSLSGTAPDVNGNALNFSPTQSSTWTIASAAGGITGFSSDAFVINTAAINGTGGFTNPVGFGTFSLAVAGNDLNLVFSPGTGPTEIVINVASGSQTQAQAGYPTIAAATSLTKTGAGTLTFDAANTYSGPTTIAAGTLQVTNAAALAATNVTVDTGATLAVAPGTTLKAPTVIVDGGTLSASSVAVNASTGIASLAINAGTIAAAPVVSIGAGGQFSLAQDARVTVGIGGLSVDQSIGGGRLDLGAGQVSIAAGGISAADLRADIIAGRNGGAWNGATGIMSSTAASTTGRAVGYVVNGDGTARVSFAAAGDVDLSGQVNVFDLVSINSSGKYGTGSASVWNQGDFNYDGVTNVFDLVAVNTAGAYGQGNYFPAAPTTSGLGSVAAVPEPGGLGFAAALAVAAVAARRRLRESSRGA